jgi:hypothetical protein
MSLNELKSSVVVDRELEERRRTIPPAHISGARSAVGLPARKTSGLARAVMNRTRSIGFARLAFNGGLKRSVSRVVAGQRTPIGMSIEATDCQQSATIGSMKVDVTGFVSHLRHSGHSPASRLLH